jgi:hypothetical protein
MAYLELPNGLKCPQMSFEMSFDLSSCQEIAAIVAEIERHGNFFLPTLVLNPRQLKVGKTMFKHQVKVLLASAGLLCSLSGCSQEAQQAHDQKADIDKQKDEQKQAIDQRAGELKTNADLNTKQVEQTADAQKNALDEVKKDAEKTKDLAKKEVDREVTADKKQVDANAHNAKAQVDQETKVR